MCLRLAVVVSRSTSRDFSTPSAVPTYPTSASGSSTSSRMKGSYYTLTPFDSRGRGGGAAKSSDYNLTPFTSRISSDSSSTALREAADITTTDSSHSAADTTATPGVDRKPARPSHGRHVTTRCFPFVFSKSFITYLLTHTTTAADAGCSLDVHV